ncbi:hypothetical protein ACFL6S_24935 [Candidatus Poribacteria bacterium]
MIQHQNVDKRVWTRMLVKMVIACVAGLLLALLLIPLLPEADMHHEAIAEEEIREVEDEWEEPSPEEEISITRVKAVEIPEIAVAQEAPNVAEEVIAKVAESEVSHTPAPEHTLEPLPLPDEATQTEEKLAHSEADETQSLTPPPPADQPVGTSPEPQLEKRSDSAPVGATRALEQIDLSSEELEVFIRTQTVASRAKVFPRIHITYENVDMGTQLSFYRSRGYGFFAVEMNDGVIAGILGKIDMDNRKLSAIDGGDGLAWNYGSVIMRYRHIATQAAANSNAYLAVVPTYDTANLILSSIDKAINGVIDGDYRNYQSYKATFTTRGQDAILTVLIPNGSSFTRREILLSRNT